jgi:hypothetical protein
MPLTGPLLNRVPPPAVVVEVELLEVAPLVVPPEDVPLEDVDPELPPPDPDVLPEPELDDGEGLGESDGRIEIEGSGESEGRGSAAPARLSPSHAGVATAEIVPIVTNAEIRRALCRDRFGAFTSAEQLPGCA